MSSTSDKLSGKANQAIGKVTGNDRVQAKGEVQESKGKLKDSLSQAGDRISQKIDDVARKTER